MRLYSLSGLRGDDAKQLSFRNFFFSISQVLKKCNCFQSIIQKNAYYMNTFLPRCLMKKSYRGSSLQGNMSIEIIFAYLRSRSSIHLTKECNLCVMTSVWICHNFAHFLVLKCKYLFNIFLKEKLKVMFFILDRKLQLSGGQIPSKEIHQLPSAPELPPLHTHR